MVKRIECSKKPVTDRGGACRRKLLATHDRAQAREAGLAPAQAERTGYLRDRRQPRIGGDQLSEGCPQVVIGTEELGHALSV